MLLSGMLVARDQQLTASDIYFIILFIFGYYINMVGILKEVGLYA